MRKALRFGRGGLVAALCLAGTIGCGDDGGKPDGGDASGSAGRGGAGGSVGGASGRGGAAGSGGVGGIAGTGGVAGTGGAGGAAGRGGAGGVAGRGGAGGVAGTGGVGGVAGTGGVGGAAGRGGAGGIAGTGGAGGIAGTGGTGAPDGGTDAPTDGSAFDVGLDLGDAPPSMLTVTIPDRRGTVFQLAWTAPSNGGQAVAGYQIRYAKVPITATNFDDTAVTKPIAYTGTPAAPGAPDGVLTKLYIENAYYFAVIGTNGSGAQVGSLMATTTAVAAHFNVSILSSPSGTNQLFGAMVDGSSDLNGDGISDLLVATVNDGRAYLFLGAAGFAPTAPTTTFSSTAMTFGGTVRAVGDIDGDGRTDLAISDQDAQRVLVFKGRATWPATLTDAQADYIISTDATWALSGFGVSIAPLGDFDGDGVTDFAIGAAGFSSLSGRVAVVYGRTGFTSFMLPDATRSLEITSDTTLNRPQFGLAVVGLGHFYTATTGTTLVVSAPGLGGATSTSANEGRLYAFHGRGPGAAIAATTADHILTGPGKPARIGQTLVNVGPVVNATPSLGVGNSGDAVSVPGTNGSSFVLSGSATTGPFASKLIFFQQGANGVGQVIFGGGFSGQDATVSIIGDSKPDIALTSLQLTGTLDIVDGSKVAGVTSPADTISAGDVHVPLPTGWSATAAGVSNLIRDINGDGFPDFALGDQFGTMPGRVAVFW